jgi:hypothetical protein
MVVRCKYLNAAGRSCGWFPGIINRIMHDAQKADIDYDDGAYDYGVPFARLRLMSEHKTRTFDVAHIPAPTAIVLSLSHAREAVVQAMQLIATIEADLIESDQDDDGAFSTPLQSRSSTPPAIITCSRTNDDDEVEFVMERFGTSRGDASRPIVL